MSRSGYNEDGDNDNWAFICYRGAVTSAIKGKRGQAFLREALATMDAMPVKELIASELEQSGKFCTLGAVGHARGIDMSEMDTTNWLELSRTFNIAEVLAREIMYMNDEGVGGFQWDLVNGRHARSSVTNVPARRWEYVRKWIAAQIIGDEVPS